MTPGRSPNDIAARMGREIARPLSSALERVAALTASGRIDRAGLAALRDEIDLARRVAIVGQQLARLSDSSLALANEPLALIDLLREAMHQHRREIADRGIELRLSLQRNAVVRSDATLLFTLLGAVLDWSFEHARGAIEVGLDIQPWPARACVRTRFACRAIDEIGPTPDAATADAAEALDTVSWCLVQQIAAALELSVSREATRSATTLTIEFPDTLPPPETSLGGGPLLADPTPPPAPVSLAATQVLVLAAQREIRTAVQGALRPSGAVLHLVDDAAQLPIAGLPPPDAIVYAAALAGVPLQQVLDALGGAADRVPRVRVDEHVKGLQIVDRAGDLSTQIGVDCLFQLLPATLRFELAHRP